MNKRTIPAESVSLVRHLSAVDPDNLAIYLEQRGWTKAMEFGPKADIWRYGQVGPSPRSAPPEITLPRHVLMVDYAERIRDILQTLEDVERRKKAAILKDVLTVPFDVITLRNNIYLVNGTPVDSVPIIASIPTIVNALMCIRPAGAESGQDGDALGSMTIVSLDDRDDAIDIVFDPSDRTTSTALFQALTDIHGAIINPEDQPDVNRRLCRVLGVMASTIGKHGLQFNFVWSPALPSPVVQGPPFRFRSTDLQAAARLHEPAQKSAPGLHI